MSYIVPFQNVSLFEATFKHQINKKKEKEEAFRQLNEERNPYHLVFGGPERLDSHRGTEKASADNVSDQSSSRTDDFLNAVFKKNGYGI